MATQITTVHTKRGRDTLREYVNPPADHMLVCARPTEVSAFRARIFDNMKQTIGTIKAEIDVLIDVYPPLKHLRLDRVDAAGFTQQLELLFESSTRWPDLLTPYRPKVLCTIDFLRVNKPAAKVASDECQSIFRSISTACASTLCTSRRTQTATSTSA